MESDLLLRVVAGVAAVTVLFECVVNYCLSRRIEHLEARVDSVLDVAEQAGRDARRSDEIAIDAVKIACSEGEAKRWRSRHGL